MATILYTWRPFVYMLYGAMYSKPSPGLPEHLRYRCQIDPPLTWIKAFLSGKRADVVKVYDVDSHFRRGTRVDIVTDASPFGLGAVLAIDGVPVEYFGIPTTAEDAQQMGLELTYTSECQQAFEALVILVALREWRHAWATTRCVLHVNSDNMAALAMMCKMQPHSPSLGVVAREVALDVADAVYDPQVATHVPGVANVCADELSRRYQPDRRFVLPALLCSCKEVKPVDRSPTWWRASLPRRGQGGEQGTAHPATKHHLASASSSASESCRTPLHLVHGFRESATSEKPTARPLR